MTDEAFEFLAAKILAGEAPPEERAQLNTLLAQDMGRRTEFAELKTAWEAMRKLGPAVRAMDAPPTPFPQHRIAELQAAVRKHFSHRATELQPNRSAGLQPASDDRIRKADCKSALRALRKTPEDGEDFDALRGRARELPDSFSVFDLLRQWLQSPRLLAGSVAAVVLFCGLFVAMRSGREKSGGTVAYLLAGEGQPEVVRGGKTVAVSAATPLQRGDEIHLNDGVAVSAITPAGLLPLKGPQRMRAEMLDALVASNRVSPTRPVNKSAATVQIALFRPLKQLTPLLAVMRDTQGIALYSPRDATLRLTPLILWKSEPGKTYDLTITDEFDRTAPPWQLRGVVSPVNFREVEAWNGRPLSTNGLYRIIIRETGNPFSTCEYTFRTLKDANGTRATTPAEKIARAYELLTTESPCPGDALAELMTLPPEFRDQPLVLRLKLAAFGPLGLQEEFGATTEKLEKAAAVEAR
jgi:hypothetical protein